MSSEHTATQIIRDQAGHALRELRPYRLSGGPGDITLRVGQPRFRIGTHASNDLVIEHPTVSRFHLEIEASPSGFRVRDLDSTNGTWVGSLRIGEAYLTTPASLRLGAVTLQFEPTGEREVIPGSTEEQFHGIVGRSPLMREIFAQLERIAPSNATVLVEGESGTGKERVATAVHQASGRSAGPFVVLDCAVIPEQLMESELFGHERGAFTGATERRQGRFVEAHGGTLFLDEIGELPPGLQPKLLRVLESREVRPLGSTKTTAVDVRVVAATNRDLARAVNDGSFREDLYYRLAVVKLRLPPLRERPEDIRPLVEHFLGELLRDDPPRRQAVLAAISEQNWRRLEHSPWRGNARQLRNFIERTLILSDDSLERIAMPSATIGSTSGPQGIPDPLSVDLERPFGEHKATMIEQFERSYLLAQLARHDHNISAAARAAGLDRMNYKRLLKKYR